MGAVCCIYNIISKKCKLLKRFNVKNLLIPLYNGLDDLCKIDFLADLNSGTDITLYLFGNL